jgi:hypothetical protein
VRYFGIPLFVIVCLMSRLLFADFLIRHPLSITSHHYLLVIVLPQYFGNFFGTWDQLDFELAKQKVSPVDPKRIQAWQLFLQKRQWQKYENSPLLGGQSIYLPKYDDFRYAERFDDGRSALFAILKIPNAGNRAVRDIWPSDRMELRALVRLSSTLFATMEDDVDRQILAHLPWQLRALRSEEAKRLESEDPIISEVGVEDQKTGIVPIFDRVENRLARFPMSFSWPEGGVLEFKAWFHDPELIRFTGSDGRTHRQIIDFLPDLLEIVHMYGGFERTGWTWADIQRVEGPELGASEIPQIGKLLGRPITAKEIGLRSREFFSDVPDPALAKREIDDFKLKPRRLYRDPDLSKFMANILWGIKREVLPAISEWAQKRAGYQSLPFSRIVTQRRRLPCREVLRRYGGPVFDLHSKVRSFAISFGNPGKAPVSAGKNTTKVELINIEPW